MTGIGAVGLTNRPTMRLGGPAAGLTTKTHALVDSCGLPLVIALTPGQSGAPQR